MHTMVIRQTALLVILILTTCTIYAQEFGVQNGSFEELDGNGVPAQWTSLGGGAWETMAEAAHTGNVGVRMSAADTQQWLRHELPGCPTRSYLVSGWFRANGVKIGPGKEEHARLYVHVHYKDREYRDTSQMYKDIPAGTYDWRRFAVRVVPNPLWEVSKIWVTVTSQLTAGELDCDDIAMEPAKAMGGVSVLDWDNGMKPVVITDMSQCQPASALADRRLKGKWKVLEYEVPPYEGKMLSANFEADAPRVTLPLNIEGWHAIYIGLMTGNLRVKLSSDPSTVSRAKSHGSVEEVYFKAADLTGESLEFLQQSKGTPQECDILYVKLVPLSDAEIQRIAAERADTSTKRLCTTIDGYSYLYSRGATTEEELLQEIEEFRDSDFGTLYLQMTGAEMVNYASDIGFNLGSDGDDLIEVFPRAGDRVYAESLKERNRTGVNATRVHVQGAKALGMTVYVCVRPAAWVSAPPSEEFFRSPMYDNHPEWRCFDRDGTPVARMSYAVPEVRAHIVNILREAVRYGADGACVLYNRGVPNVLFEEPFCKLFQEKYGEDALKIDEKDPRIRELRVEIMTGFMQEIRAMLDEEQASRGQADKLRMAAMVLADEADNLEYGIDVRGWIDKGLLDEVGPYLRAGGSKARSYDLKFFAEVCDPKGIPWRPTVVSWQVSDLSDMMELVADLYEGGASGITFWDGNSLTARTDRWPLVSRLGHLDELREFAGQGAPTTTILRPHRLGDFIVDGRYGVPWGF